MKSIFLFSLVFFGFNAFSANFSGHYMCGAGTGPEGLRYAFTDTNTFYFNVFEKDLNMRVVSTLEQAGLNLENIDHEQLRPRDSFTKPHRLHLMRRFQTNINCHECFNKVHLSFPSYYRFINFESRWLYSSDGHSYTTGSDDTFFSKESVKFRDILLVPLALKYMRLTRERFNLLETYTIQDYPNALAEHRECARNNRPIVESAIENWSREDRWWFNDNIKPLLEQMIMVWDLWRGEYEPY